MLPLFSEAFAVMVIEEPAEKLLALFGLVIAADRPEGLEPILFGNPMVMVAGAEVTTTPLLSVAWAVMV